MGRDASLVLTINGMYIDADVGTGTYTRALSAALPEAAIWRPGPPRLNTPFDYVGAITTRALSRSSGAYYHKLWDETCMRRAVAKGVHLHPYPAIALDRSAVLSVLDLIHYRSANSLNRRLISRSIRMALDLLTISSVTADEVAAEFGRQAHVVEPIPAPEFFSTPRTPARRPGTLRVAYWGGWHRRKSILPAIEALASTPIELVAVGSAESLVVLPGGLRVRTVAPLSTSELVSMVDSCDVALYPSSEEGYGLPVVEALLRDRPVIVQPLAPYQAFLRPGAPGVVTFEPDDPGSLIRAVEVAGRVSQGAALGSLLLSDLRRARERMRDQLLAVPALRAEMDSEV